MKYINALIQNYPNLNPVKKDIISTLNALKKSFASGGKLLICGNGGSEADASHIQGELMKSFCKKRVVPTKIMSSIKKIDKEFFIKKAKFLEAGFPVINISSASALNTALINDTDPEIIYANSVLSLGLKGDILLAITTSGNSKNIVDASIVAKALGMTVIALTGNGGGKIKKYSDECIIVPEKETYRIQEYHLPIYHALCLELEDIFFK